MDSSRERRHHTHRSYRTSPPRSRHRESNYRRSPSSRHGVLRPRDERSCLSWRKDYYDRENYRSRHPYKKHDEGSKKSSKTPEDKEEEERKKKLNDTAKELLNKIKTWNAEKNENEDDSQQCNTINNVVSESNCKNSEEKSSCDNKPKRIAHSKNTQIVKSKTKKSPNKPTKTATRYDVNKDTVKDFQNRIQHKLIEEIMQMPKENLQNVLNDPKINPVMEKKMSRLVKENKPLIAQKLRSLAESKMNSLGYSTNANLLDDIDKLIDPVIETDLSVLPYELIKQMENVFQVQFDYSPNNPLALVENNVCESALDNLENIPMEIDNTDQVVAVKTDEDLSVYECSTDEDDEISIRKSVELECKPNQVQETLESDKTDESRPRTPSSSSEAIVNDTQTDAKPLEVTEPESPQENEKPASDSALDLITNQYISEEPIQSTSESIKFFATASCQTEIISKNAFTQTMPKMETLYGAPIPKETTDCNISSLLEEVNSIQTLSNKLNQRRLMIFLELAKTNPSGSFLSDNFTKNSFIESMSNGNYCLVNSLKQFFSKKFCGQVSLNKKVKWKKKKKSKIKKEILL